MTIRLKVTLDESATPWKVVVDEQNNANHIGRHPESQKIIWNLQGEAADGTFADFHWLGEQPRPGIFRKLRGMYTDRLSIKDRNDCHAHAGNWNYHLSICLRGKTYSTVGKVHSPNTSNPMIKNT